eukprot:325323_1
MTRNVLNQIMSANLIVKSDKKSQFGINLYLNLTIGGFEPFQPIHKSIERTHYYDTDMVLHRSEFTSEGMGAALFNQLMHATAQFIQPVQDSYRGVSSYNPFLLSVVLIVLLSTAMIGFITYYCLVYSRKLFEKKVSVFGQ